MTIGEFVPSDFKDASGEILGVEGSGNDCRYFLYGKSEPNHPTAENPDWMPLMSTRAWGWISLPTEAGYYEFGAGGFTLLAPPVLSPTTEGDETPPPGSDAIAINLAADAELDAIEGVGPATIEKIVAARPIANPDDLKAIAPAVEWDQMTVTFETE